MSHPTETPPASISAIRPRKPAAWVLRGDAAAVARARRAGLSIHAKEE